MFVLEDSSDDESIHATMTALPSDDSMEMGISYYSVAEGDCVARSDLFRLLFRCVGGGRLLLSLSVPFS